MGYLHIFSDIAKFIEHIVAVGGYPLLFVLLFFEAMPLIGTVVPGHIAIVFSGFLISLGVFNPWMTIIVGLVAAILGDYASYRIGNKYGISFIDRFRPFFWIKDEHIAKAQRLISNHTGKSMIIGRLSPVTRSLVPFFVGTSHTHEKRFWFFNIIGGCLWVVFSITLGYIFGTGYEVAVDYTGRLILILIILAIMMTWGYYFINKQFHIFRRYELFMLATTILSASILAYTVRDTFISVSNITQFDVLANLFIVENTTLAMINVAWYVSMVGSVAVVGVFGVILSFILVYRHKWRSVIIILMSLGSTALVLGFVKEFFMRVRPLDQFIQPILGDPSFPSGHSAMAAAFFIVVAYLAMPKIESWILRETVFVFCMISIILVGISRLVLNVHWVSDVVAGWALGALCASLSVLFVRYVAGIVHKKVVENL